MAVKSLTVDALYQRCPESWLPFETTDSLANSEGFVGQERAVDALLFGVSIPHDGYNLFVTGSVGVGKDTLVRHYLDDEAHNKPIPMDWCYVNNFDAPYKPKAICLPAGVGATLKCDMESLLSSLLISIPELFKSDDYRNSILTLKQEFEEREGEAFQQLTTDAKTKKVAVIRTPQGYTLGPLKDGKLLSQEEFDRLPQAVQDELKANIEFCNQELQALIKDIPRWQEELRHSIDKVNEEYVTHTVGPMIESLKRRYAAHPEVEQFLEAVNTDLIANAEDFIEPDSAGNDHSIKSQIQASPFKRFHVNLLVDHTATEGAPILHELNPNFRNVMGRVEHVAHLGTLMTDFTLIKPGALHRANGGYLILDAQKLLASPYAWDALKRSLSAKEIKIESVEDTLSLNSTVSLEPEAIPLDLKVVLLGDRFLYYLLDAYDPEFRLLFKVCVDFEEDFQRTEASVHLYSTLIASLIQKHLLLPFSRDAVAAVIEHGARQVENADKLSLHMGRLEDLLFEANYWAEQSGEHVVSCGSVEQALHKRRYRSSQYYERLIEQVTTGVRAIETSGEKVGQVNGLSVISLGDVAFGQPSKITASVRFGHGKIIDVERESELGGSLHSKGVFIISSLLATRYAKDRPLSLSASIVFEQSYGEVDGDSASTAELCALLSAIAEVPLFQHLAITGSINQHGQVQAIGGVNEKIEGFFDVCSAIGLVQSQGVIIPAANTRHLMLRKDVVTAVAEGRFNIHAVESLEDALTLLTGLPMGALNEQGAWPEDSFNYHLYRKLDRYAECAKKLNESTESSRSQSEKE